MIKILVKKEFLEMWRSLFVNTKTGEKTKKSKTALLIALYIALGLFLLGIFYFLSYQLGTAFIRAGLGWFYFTFISMLAVAFGIFGDVFNTHAMLYASKDNDLLFSLPIKSGDILFSRMLVVLLTGTGYMSLVYIPAIVAYWVASPSFSIVTLLLQIVMMAALALIVMTLTCALGWVIAKLMTKMKSKNVAKIIASLLFLGIYYFVSARASEYIKAIIENADAVSSSIKKVYFLYALGQGCTGSFHDALIVVGVSATLTGLCFYLLSRSFIRLSTENGKSEKKAYSSSQIKVLSPLKALVKREERRFITSTVYALNTGLGLVVMLAGAVALFFFRSRISAFTTEIEEAGAGFLRPYGAATVLLLIISMNGISAPSVSLEGKNIWIVQSLPVEPFDVLKSKIIFCFVPSAAASVILLLSAVATTVISIKDLPLVLLFALVYSLLMSETGLMLNLLHPSLHWTNEASCVKNGFATYISLFGGWAVAALFAFIYFKFLFGVMNIFLYLLIYIAVFVIGIVLETLWLKKKGSAVFQYLS